MTTDDRPGLDAIDRTIIGALRRDGRMSITRLADDVALSTSATSERVRRLEERGVVTGYHAAVSPDALARPVDAVVGVRGQPGADRTSLEAWSLEQEAVVEAVHLTGPHDDLLRLRCRTTAELDDLLMVDQGRTAPRSKRNWRPVSPTSTSSCRRAPA